MFETIKNAIFASTNTKISMLILTKNTIKEIRSLEQRKARQELGVWLAEGNKMVGDLLKTAGLRFHCRKLVATREWWIQNAEFEASADECYEVTRAEMDRVSLLHAPQDVLGVFALPSQKEACPMADPEHLSILLDEVQDPGNVGTIIRTADWFGIRDIFCAPGTADCFSPKVVQATMSALARVRLHYFKSREELIQWLDRNDSMLFYGTFLEGENIYQKKLEAKGLLIMGNEGRGISDEVAKRVNQKLLIPAMTTEHVESLNVGIATAICLSEINRKRYSE